MPFAQSLGSMVKVDAGPWPPSYSRLKRRCTLWSWQLGAKAQGFQAMIAEAHPIFPLFDMCQHDPSG